LVGAWIHCVGRGGWGGRSIERKRREEYRRKEKINLKKVIFFFFFFIEPVCLPELVGPHLRPL
jgi:hypothetical protein